MKPEEPKPRKLKTKPERPKSWLKRCNRCHNTYDIHVPRCPSCQCQEYGVEEWK